MPGIAIVIPTYNEAGTIVELLTAIRRVLPEAHLIIVDDGSPDGTAEIVRRVADQKVYLIERIGKLGRGSACLAGFRLAMTLPVDQVLEMDVDFSHAPTELPSLLAITDNYGMTVASRYLAESKIIGWPWQRRWFSCLANHYIRTRLHLPLHDCTNGFRSYSRAALAGLDFDGFLTSGHIVLSEIACRLANRGVTFYEVPTVFTDRRRGASTVTWREIYNAFCGVNRLARHLLPKNTTATTPTTSQ